MLSSLLKGAFSSMARQCRPLGRSLKLGLVPSAPTMRFSQAKGSQETDPETIIR